MGAYTYVSELWKKKQSDVMRFLLRVRCWEYRQVCHHPPRQGPTPRLQGQAGMLECISSVILFKLSFLKIAIELWGMSSTVSVLDVVEERDQSPSGIVIGTDLHLYERSRMGIGVVDKYPVL
ncbi:UNVERIFIED_CONTAM: 60S ribosomal protein L15 [Sesamum calycinum]|uniref:Ribosomal protein L15 n=1 Tax=Sesamum calycinum TaxID=2727403 RepID=A0AAW2PBP7_9LAMI